MPSTGHLWRPAVQIGGAMEDGASPARILIIEDDTDLRETPWRALSREGDQGSQAGDGTEASSSVRMRREALLLHLPLLSVRLDEAPHHGGRPADRRPALCGERYERVGEETSAA